MSGKVSAQQGGAITSRKRASLNVAKQKVSPSTRQWPPGTVGDNSDLISPWSHPRRARVSATLPTLLFHLSQKLSAIAPLQMSLF